MQAQVTASLCQCGYISLGLRVLPTGDMKLVRDWTQPDSGSVTDL